MAEYKNAHISNSKSLYPSNIAKNCKFPMWL